MRTTSRELEIQLSVREREILREALETVMCRGKNSLDIMCSGLIKCCDCPFGHLTGELSDYLELKDGRFVVIVKGHDGASDD